MIRPYLVARYGVYLAVAIAALSVFLAQGAGTALDTAIFRALFIFLLFTALAFGAEAVIISAPSQQGQQHQPASDASLTQSDEHQSPSELEEDAA